MQITRGKIQRAQKVVIYGPEGIGKSTFAAQFPDPVFIDTEGSTYHLDVARTPKPSSWTMLLEQVKYYRSNPGALGTLVIDTADWAEQLCADELCAKSQKSGIEDFGYGKGYIYLGEEFGRLLNLLEELVERGVNVVMTAHAQMRKFEQPDEMGSYDRWEMKLQKKTAPLLKEWADLVLFANYKTHVIKTDDKGKKGKAQGGKRIMFTTHHPCWDAKNRHGLSEELPLDYAEIKLCIPTKDGIITDSGSSTISTTKGIAAPAPPQNPPVEELAKEPNKESPNTEPPALNTLQSEPAKTEPQAPPIPHTASEKPPQTNTVEEQARSDLTGIPKPLADLMAEYSVTLEEIQAAVVSRGYYPEGTPFANYDPGFIDGVLVGAWSQVLKIIQDLREDIPF